MGIAGIDIGTGGPFVRGVGGDVESPGTAERLLGEPPGSVLHRCKRSLRLANFSLPSSVANISSTHSRS